MKIGRMTRKMYLILSLIMIGFNVLFVREIPIVSGENVSMLSLCLIFTIIISFRLNIGRLKDINLSVWYSLLILVPIINIIFFALFFIDGTKGPNKYGADPKGRINEKLILEKRAQNAEPKKSPKIIDDNIRLLEESYKEGILNKNEFEFKKNSLLEEKQNIVGQSKNDEAFKKKKEKLKILLEKKLLSHSDYETKLNHLLLEYGTVKFKDDEIELDTMFFYVQRGKEFGPYSTREIIKRLNTSKINPNCLVRIENEKSYTRRAHEIYNLFK